MGPLFTQLYKEASFLQPTIEAPCPKGRHLRGTCRSRRLCKRNRIPLQ